MTSQLVGTDFTDGALLPNYVNGRLLVAEDLATGQQSLRTRDTRIGEAAGAGIVRGLWVTSTQTTLSIGPGLALSRAGAPVVVPKAVTLKLTRSVTAQPVDDSDFACCGPGAGDEETSALTQGLLLLTARPSCRLDGQAPLVPPPTSQTSSCCAAQWQVEGVEFRAIVLPVGAAVAGESVTTTNRRNLVAHWCFGTEQLLGLGRDPFSFDPAYGGFDRLPAADLTAYDVPLAVLHWDGHAVTDLDNWSARRRVTEPDPVPSPWSATVSERRESDGIARFLQFQNQAEELVSRSLAGSAIADTYFGYLPPVGFLPVDSGGMRTLAENSVRDLLAEEAPNNEPVVTHLNEPIGVAANLDETAEAVKLLRAEQLAAFKSLLTVADASGGYGFTPQRFFGSLARPGGFIDWELAEWFLEQSWRAMPVATGSREDVDGDEIPVLANEKERGEIRTTTLFTYYYVIQNIEAAAARTALKRSLGVKGNSTIGSLSAAARLYVVFIANRRWATKAEAPVMPYSTTRLAGER